MVAFLHTAPGVSCIGKIHLLQIQVTAGECRLPMVRGDFGPVTAKKQLNVMKMTLLWNAGGGGLWSVHWASGHWCIMFTMLWFKAQGSDATSKYKQKKYINICCLIFISYCSVQFPTQCFYPTLGKTLTHTYLGNQHRGTCNAHLIFMFKYFSGYVRNNHISLHNVN